LIATLSQSARANVGRVLIHDHADRDEIASRLIR
jgi:hypothetical protein